MQMAKRVILGHVGFQIFLKFLKRIMAASYHWDPRRVPVIQVGPIPPFNISPPILAFCRGILGCICHADAFSRFPLNARLGSGKELGLGAWSNSLIFLGQVQRI